MHPHTNARTHIHTWTPIHMKQTSTHVHTPTHNHTHTHTHTHTQHLLTAPALASTTSVPAFWILSVSWATSSIVNEQVGVTWRWAVNTERSKCIIIRTYWHSGTSLQRAHWDQLICPLCRVCPLLKAEKGIRIIEKFTFGASKSVLCT